MSTVELFQQMSNNCCQPVNSVSVGQSQSKRFYMMHVFKVFLCVLTKCSCEPHISLLILNSYYVPKHLVFAGEAWGFL